MVLQRLRGALAPKRETALSGAPEIRERAPKSVTPLRIWFLTAALAAITAVAWTLEVHQNARATTFHELPWVVIALALFAVKLLDISLPFRNGAVIVDLVEIPMVVGIVCLSPEGLLLAVITGYVAAKLVRGQISVKVGFNAMSFALAAAAGHAAYLAVINHSSPVSLLGWLAALVSVLVLDGCTDIAVMTAMGVSTRRVPKAEALATLQAKLTSVPVSTGLAIITISLTWANRWAGLLVIGLGGSALLVQRSGNDFRRRYSNLERLYRFTEGTSGATELAEAIPLLLRRSRDVMGAASAEMVLAHPTGVVHYRLDPSDRMIRRNAAELTGLARLADEAGTGILATRTERSADIRTALSDLGVRDALAVPLAGSDGLRGVIMVTNHQGSVSFDADDLRLFEVLALHSAVAIRGGLLLDRLQEEVEAREHEALHDSLTGLANRSLFTRALEGALATRPVGRMVPVMIMDLDGFKEINDTMGHHMGDAVLREIGGRMASVMACEGMVARLGGDEFAFVLPNLADRGRVSALAQAVQDAVNRPVEVEGMVLGLRASLGVAHAPEHGEEPSILLRRADVAMYAAKSSGGGLAIYDPSVDHHSTRRLLLATELRSPGQIDKIDVWFQPMAELATGNIIGCEALARWTHPLHGAIPPEEFIPVAEQSGSIGALTWRMLEMSLKQTKEWHDRGLTIGVAVNISAHTLLEAGLVERLARLLADIGVGPQWLTLELTESTIMADPVQSGGVLSILGQLGVGLAIDDFGTGHSSLTRLKRLPIHIVKIDKSFVTSMSADHGDAAIVRSTVELARNLGHIVVAEGVEDQVTWERLAALGCDRAQGYYLARPMPGAAVENWLRPRWRANLSLVRPANEVRGA